MNMLKVIYKPSSEYPPFIDFENAEIVLTYGGKLYARGTDGPVDTNPYNGKYNAWGINKKFKGYYINEILDKIKPYAEKLFEQMDVENTYKDDKIGYKLFNTIRDIIDHENAYHSKEHIVQYMNVYEFVKYMQRLISPEAIEDYYIYNNSLDIGFIFAESTLQEAIDHAYDILFDYFETSYNYTRAIKDIYNAYKRDNYKNEFFTEFLPKLASMYDDIVSYENGELYIEGEPVNI